MKINPDFFIGVFEDDHLVGVTIISSDNRKGWINRLAVDPDHRRRGIARTLLAESERILKKRGIRILCALVEDCNMSSGELLKSCGYSERRSIAYFRESDNCNA